MEDHKALLLIRAMIAAANADGEITAVERQRILGKLDEAGADPDDRRIIEQELQQPRSLDALLRDVTDPETAEQVYLGVGKMAITLALRRRSHIFSISPPASTCRRIAFRN